MTFAQMFWWIALFVFCGVLVISVFAICADILFKTKYKYFYAYTSKFIATIAEATSKSLEAIKAELKNKKE